MSDEISFVDWPSLLTPHCLVDCFLPNTQMKSALWICAGQRHGRRSYLWKSSTPSSSGELTRDCLRFKLAFTRKGRRDRRKLTFYFIADKRIDFRELVRELFRYVCLGYSGIWGGGANADLVYLRVFKTRIWLSALSSSGNYEQ